MKKMRFFAGAVCATVLAMGLTACSDNEGGGKKGDWEEIGDVHFDIWTSTGGTSGMGSSATILVRSVNSLEEGAQIDCAGSESHVVSDKINEEVIVHDNEYYQINVINSGKNAVFKIDNRQGVVFKASYPMGKNSFKERSYTHAWIGDELVVMAANGAGTEILWSKYDEDTMRPLEEGSLNLGTLTASEEAPEFKYFSTSGLLRYRKSDNRLLYFFQKKNGTGRSGVSDNKIYMAVIDPVTMRVEAWDADDRAEQIAGTAYGELLQNKMFFDGDGNLYVACNSQIPGAEKSTCQFGRLVRVKAGEKRIDRDYLGASGMESKLVTVDYIGNGKALLYLQNPRHTGCSENNALAAGWGEAYNCYYALLDLRTDAMTEFVCNGQKLPFSMGTFSQRSLVLNGKAYLGTNPRNSAPTIYVYDILTGQTRVGCTLKEGVDFSRIVYVED